MEKILAYLVLGLAIVLPLFQILYIWGYFKRFLLEYFNGKPSTWNPKYDRITLFFSIVFCIISFYLGTLIYQTQISSSWFEPILYLFIVVVLSFFVTLIVSIARKKRNSLN
ncbi:hypothetical protein [Capnocytophaga stomatis]|uniref:hypothetical protein n=1 Tax=Capnocytophaga stomatis TaxID=1848904 RepID=UPI00195149B4|nr:hypothetical protein [Capnocytophaga stomatis]